PALTLPVEPEGHYHVYHQYTIRHPRRGALAEALRERGIDSAGIYPVALHQHPLYEKLGCGNERLPAAAAAAPQVLPVPVHPSLGDGDVQAVADARREAALALA